MNNDRSIDLSSIPMREADGKYLWKNAKGCKCQFTYKGKSGVLEIIGYNHDASKIIIKYNDIIKEVGGVSLRGAKLGILFNEHVLNYKLNIGDILHNGLSDIQIIELIRINRLKAYKYKCLTCGNIGQALETDLLRNDNRLSQGCPVCNKVRIIEGKNTIALTANWMIPYFVNKEEAYHIGKCDTNEYLMQCPYCGTTKTYRPIYLYKLQYMPCDCLCKTSLPEYVMLSILKQFNIKYIALYCNKLQKWIGKYRYDFYLPEYNIIIETHGGLHYHYCNFTKITVKELLLIDNTKRELALSNGISNYYEINCSNADNINKWINDCDNKGLFKLLNINKKEIDKDSISIKPTEIDIINEMELYMQQIPKPTRLNILDHFGISRHVYDRYRRFIIKRKELKNGINQILSL